MRHILNQEIQTRQTWSHFLPLNNCRIEKFRTCQISKKSLTTNHILKWTWFVQKPIFMNDLLEDNHFSILLPRKTPNSLGMCFLKNHDMEKKWKKNSFESRLLKRIRFWNRFPTTRQILNQEFQNTSDF